MKKVLIDIDVILDVLAKRDPFFAPAANLWKEIEERRIRADLAAHSITTLFYLIRKERGRGFAKESIRNLLTVFEIASIDKKVLLSALESDFKDFEDAVQSAAAKHTKVDVIITRNVKDFRKSEIPAMSADSFLAVFGRL